MHPSGKASYSNISGNEVYNNDNRRPIRLLVIGDSLAIGVGQSRQCTPVMPEVLAKTLSARLGGRTVYWTCHGAIGASTGWIIRELERGVKKVDTDNTCIEEEDDENEVTVSVDKGKNLSDTDESSVSDDSATLSPPPQPLSKVVEMVDASISLKEQRTIWRERLAQHRKYLDPDVSGQFDVVVVMAGGNDIKSGLFPFLCTGEDAEFRRQAQSRSGNYTRELSRLVQIIKRDVKSKLRHIRYTVEVAAETVIEKVEQNIELIAKSTASPAVRRMSATASSLHELLHAKNEEFLNSECSSNDSEYDTADADTTNEERSTKKSPLVVLPGLASRSLPVFRPVPLNWAACLVVDILDMHKRRLALSCPDEVMFVPPASPYEMQEYESCQGKMWQHRCEENTVLALRDIRRHECRKVEKELRDYYNVKDQRKLSGEGLKIQLNNKGWLSSLFTLQDICPGLFSIDRVHPNEDGYDFYGRYIGNSIADQWLANPKLIPPE
jgi:lysophospholipase L1-like esterase